MAQTRLSRSPELSGGVDGIRLREVPSCQETSCDLASSDDICRHHQPRQTGLGGPDVFPLALGCMGMSGMYGPADERESIATIHAALDAGVTLLDTGDYYGAGHNELLIGRALRDRRDKALLSVKFGALRGPDGGWLGMDARPVAVKNFLCVHARRGSASITSTSIVPAASIPPCRSRRPSARSPIS